MSNYAKLSDQLDDALLSPTERTLWEKADDVISEHETEIGALQSIDFPIPISATTVATNAQANAAFLAAAGEDAVVGDVMIAVVGAAKSLLVKDSTSTWQHFTTAGALTDT